MTNHISIETLSPITHNQIPVVTTELLANLYGTDTANIKKNYSRNKDRFVEGKQYFLIKGEQLRELKNSVTSSHQVDKRTPKLTLWTERGAARHAKMLETDQAWEVFEKLEDCYFSQKEKVVPARSPERGHPAPTFRYIITLTYKDAVTGQEETFTGGANNPGEIIQGTARRFGIFVSEMINIPVVAY